MTREEAIDIIRDTYHTDTELEALKVLIPELKESKESEDERIRKAIVTLIKDLQHYSTNYAGVDPTEMLAWLEKQKEPTTEELYAEAGTTEKEYIANTMRMVRAMREKQKEQTNKNLGH